MPQLEFILDSCTTKTHHMFRFAALSILFLIIGIIMYIIMMFYERFVEDKLGQFTDLCSLSNVSVFILYYQYYGFGEFIAYY